MNKMLLYYHGPPSRVTRSSGSPHAQREIRYGAREYSWRPTQMPHQMRLYYHDATSRVTRSSGPPHAQREIRYGARE
eukprot:scaffold6424_cov72-Skeletonema_dohrnii-CCMP3373.AAC.1